MITREMERGNKEGDSRPDRSSRPRPGDKYGAFSAPLMQTNTQNGPLQSQSELEWMKRGR